MQTVAPWTLGQLSSPECWQLLRRGSQEQSGAPYFGLAARCARSQRSQLAMVDDVTRRQCEQLAARKEALAFSYSSRGRQCLVNACPEIGARASLAADRRFLYYSRYSGRARVPLSCYLYRAWAPRHPRTTGPDNGCVTLDSSGRWRTTRCAQRHAFLCELLPPERRSPGSGAVKGDLTAGGITSEDVTVLDYCSKNDSMLRNKQPDLWARELK
ncbi:uncharacterized protein LOC126273347 [Schistocerca gregaria]|uniref:uncharacterized protein LOC126273347 n=1 Tax=Schistocerca gregaria TaxID=7010 RepID=UPI00211E4C22|nr:uncharacterized protein LOC126273347 [Schistocerca gregaria]